MNRNLTARSVVRVFVLTLVSVLGSASLLPLAFGQAAGPEGPERPCLLSSSAFMLANLDSKDSPQFCQLALGYRLSRTDVLALEFITWRYFHPLGIPYGPSFDSDDERYPGRVRGTGAGLAYQHYWWRGLYTGAHATGLRQSYEDLDGRLIRHGFQLLTVARLGYHVEFARGRWYVEPSIAATAWPINTNVPEEFKARDEKWKGYFLGEPGVMVGVRF
ncbi:MAG: hypothetical protein IPK72_21765 [Candidatus Eisenbacteria bacterium]|nr:hypothetical protein [Candidatus Eisenbacteria bacterium]